VRLRIRGTVQGVSFRASAREQALRLGVTGWVRNTPNGDVEAHVEGGSDNVAAFIRWCERGPEEAAVESVTVQEAAAETNFDTFSVVQ
jgi:acylphosphatase